MPGAPLDVLGAPPPPLHAGSLVQLPLHAALARQLLIEHARSVKTEGGSVPLAPQALGAVMRQLRRSCTSLQELHCAAQLHSQVDAYESDSSSEGGQGSGRDSSSSSGSSSSSDSSSGGGEEAGLADKQVATAARQLRREQRKLRRQLEHDGLRERRQERRLQHQQRQQQLAAMLAGALLDAAGPAAQHRGGRGGRQGAKQRKRKGAVSVVQQREPGSPAFELLLQQAGLLPLRRPRGRAAEAASAPFGPAQQGRQLRDPSGPLLLNGAALQRLVEEAIRSRVGASSAAAVAQAAAVGQGQQAQAGWQLRPRAFVLHGAHPQHAAARDTQGAGSGPHQQQQQHDPGHQQQVALPLRVQAASAATAVLTLVERPAPAVEGAETPATAAAAAAATAGSAAGRPLLQLPLPQPVGAEASAALQQLRDAWG